MKLKTDSVPVEIGGEIAVGDFHIKNSATAFAILSSGLYSNKYEAILRELGCNAYDSHVEAGCAEKPFTVHLPTRLNPVFSVRDYGVGLDHEQVMGLYTTYFESTKNDSNDFVGCMGLGSKSPFSYTKNFTITAVKDGMKGQYSAFIGDKGVPAIVQLLSEKTDEGNGVEVSFAVEERSDMRQFKHEASKVYKWFIVRPEFTGEALSIPELKYAEMDIIPGTHMEESQGYYHNDSVAIMGNVAYPIDIPDGEELPDGIRSLLHENKFVIRFDIGELDIAASREELSYTPRTIENLIKKGEEIMAALEIYVVKKIQPAKTKWDRNVLAAELINSNEKLFGTIVGNYLQAHKAQFVKGTTRQYSRLEIAITCAEMDKIVGIKYTLKTIRRNYNDHSKTQLVNNKTTSQEKPKRQHTKVGTSGYQPQNRWEVHQFNAADTMIVFNDEKGNILKRIRQGYVDPDYKDLFSKVNLFIFQAQNKDVDKKKILKFLKTRFGKSPILLASQLPKAAALSGALGNTNITVQKFINKHTGRYGREEHTFDAVNGKMKDIEPTVCRGKKKIFLYLKLSHKSVLKPDGTGTWDATTMMDYLDTCEIAKIAGIDLNKVYGVNKTSLKTVTQDKRWVNFFDYISEEFDKIDWKTARAETEHKIIGQQFSESDYLLTKVDNPTMVKMASNKTPIGIMFAHWNKWRATTPAKAKKGIYIEYVLLIRVMQVFFPDKDFSKTSAKLDVTKIEEKYEKIFEKVEEAYPMLRHLSLSENYHSGSHWVDALNYIKLIDSTK